MSVGGVGGAGGGGGGGRDRRGPRPTWAWCLLRAILPVVATGLALAALWPVYQSPEFVRLAVVAVLGGAAIAVLGARFRWSSLLVAAVAVALFLAAGVQLAIPAEAAAGGVLPSGPGFVHLLQATVLSWRQLVTIVTPVGAYQALLVPALILGLATSVVATSVALRARHPRLAVLAPLVLLALAIALGPATPLAGWPLAIGGLLSLVSAVWAVLSADGPDRRVSTPALSVPGQRARARRLAVTRVAAVALVLAVALAGSSALAVALAPATDRDVVRAHVEQPFVPRDYPSPLAAFRSYLGAYSRDSTLFTIEGMPEGARVRLATVDTYTGVVYAVGDPSAPADASADGTGADGTAADAAEEADAADAAANGPADARSGAGSAADAPASGIFTRVPYRLVPDVTGTRVTVDITIGDLADVWVPDLGALEQLRFSGPRADALTDTFSYNAATGTAAVSAGLRAGDAYRLTAILPDGADTGTGDAPNSGTGTANGVDISALRPGPAVLPEPAAVPEALTDWLDRTTAGADSPGDALQTALDALASTGYVSHGVDPDEPRSVSGHGVARLETLFTAVPMVGDQEQYATAAALIARQLGFPARVVVGFHPTAATTDGGAAGSSEGNSGGSSAGTAEGTVAGAVEVTGSDIDAWVEVQDASGRWNTVDPTPPVRDIPDAVPEEPTPVSKPQTVVPPPVVDEPEDQSPTSPDSEVSDPPAEQPWWLGALLVALRVAGGMLLAAALVAAPFLAVIAAKARRRRTRRRRGSARDRIRSGWFEARDTAIDYGIDIPASATRREAATAIGGKTATTLAAVADRVTFSPDRPDDDDADRVWQGVDELRRRVAERHTRRERLRARVSLASFRRPRR